MTAVVPAAFSGLKRSFIASNDSFTVISASAPLFLASGPPPRSIGNYLREGYRHRGPLVQGGLGIHGTMQGRGHEIVNDRKAQARAALRPGGGEEGVENVRQVLRRDAGAMIAHHKDVPRWGGTECHLHLASASTRVRISLDVCQKV